MLNASYQESGKMKLFVKSMTALLTITVVMSSAWAIELTGISNFREYSPDFASSGQPTREQIELLKSEGFERIIYIAFSNNPKAIADEDVLVKKLGMEYVHIPVVWDNPSVADFYAFADVMQRYPDKKSLLHCQVNYRASAFSFLYRVLYQDVPVAFAKADMDTVWQPDETWRQLIFSILEENGKSALCESCEWEN
jgi:protein tyrosine phosphatase (PTP) superfamily phosphohydrolase (DUF442 family)